jgi:hypothetical protein
MTKLTSLLDRRIALPIELLRYDTRRTYRQFQRMLGDLKWFWKVDLYESFTGKRAPKRYYNLPF